VACPNSGPSLSPSVIAGVSLPPIGCRGKWDAVSYLRVYRVYISHGGIPAPPPPDHAHPPSGIEIFLVSSIFPYLIARILYLTFPAANTRRSFPP
jgi:hypothetical protein